MLRTVILMAAVLMLTGCFHDSVLPDRPTRPPAEPPLEGPPPLAIDFLRTLGEGETVVLVHNNRPLRPGSWLRWEGEISFDPYPAVVVAINADDLDQLEQGGTIGLYPCAGNPQNPTLSQPIDCTFRASDADNPVFMLVAHFPDDGDDALFLTELRGGLIETRGRAPSSR